MPVSVLCTDADPPDVIEAVPTLTLGAAVSMVTLDALVAVAGPVFAATSLTE